MSAGIADTYIAYKIIKMLSTPFKKMEAYKLGIIDEKGRRIRTDEADKAASNAGLRYTNLHKVVINIKRMIATLPFGRTRLAGFASALWLLREEAYKLGLENENLIEDLFLDYLSTSDFCFDLNESKKHPKQLLPGKYKVKKYVFTLKESLSPVGEIFEIPVYNYKNVIFSFDDIVEYTLPDDGTDESLKFAKMFVPGQDDIEETTNTVGSGNIAGIAPGDIPPVKKKKRDKFAGYDVFDLETEEYCKFNTGPRERYERWSKRLNMENPVCQEIKQYALSNPKRGIIIRDKENGMMTFLRRD